MRERERENVQARGKKLLTWNRKKNLNKIKVTLEKKEVNMHLWCFDSVTIHALNVHRTVHTSTTNTQYYDDYDC